MDQRLNGGNEEFGMAPSHVTVHCDSQSAILLMKNHAHQKRTKYIDVRLHFVREVARKGAVYVVKIHSGNNPSESLTKVLPTAQFKRCLKLISIVSIGEEKQQ